MKPRTNSKPCLKKSKYKASSGVCSDFMANLSYVVNEVILEIWDSLLDCSQETKGSRRNFSGRVVSIESKSKRRCEENKGRKRMDQGNEHHRDPQRQRVTWAPTLDSVDSDDANGHIAEEAVFPQHKIVKKSEKRDEIPISIRSSNESRLSAPSQAAKSKPSSSTASVTKLPAKNSKEHVQDQKSKPNGTATDSSAAIGKGKKIGEDRLKGVVTSQKQRVSNNVHSNKKSENVAESTSTPRKSMMSDETKKKQKDVTALQEVAVVKQTKMGLPKLSSKLWLI
jgi:hypothetical protein